LALLVNGQLVTDEAIAQQRSMLAGALGAAARPGDPRLEQAAQENAVMQALLDDMAGQAGFPISEQEFAEELTRRRGSEQSTQCSPDERAMILHQMRVQRVIDDLTRNVPRPPARAVQAFYDANRERFQQGPSVRVRHIIINVDEMRPLEEAQQLIGEAEAALAKGQSFEKVARRFSDCGGNFGELGWITAGEMVEEFDQVVFNLKPGQRSGVFRTRFGLHIAEVSQRRPAGVQPFAEVRNAIARDMFETERQRVLIQTLRNIAAQADVRAVVVDNRAARAGAPA
jgi:parvulin-like peptidyl-prolyl isomerase